MSAQDTMVSLSAIGLDAPGLVSTITAKIFEMGGNIGDMEEHARRDLFFIFLVIDFSASPLTIDEITPALKAIENETGLRVSVGLYDEEGLSLVPEKESHIVTILGVDQHSIITGELEEPIITSAGKNEILDFIMNAENIGLEQVIAVGDGSTRSHFIKNVGLSIAFKPDEESIKTDGVLSSDHILNMLYYLGIPKTDLDKYVSGTLPNSAFCPPSSISHHVSA